MFFYSLAQAKIFYNFVKPTELRVFGGAVLVLIVWGCEACASQDIAHRRGSPVKVS